MSEETRKPIWSTYDYEGDCWWIGDRIIFDGDTVAYSAYNFDATELTVRANACEGIPRTALEAGVIQDLIAFVEQAWPVIYNNQDEDAVTERNELLDRILEIRAKLKPKEATDG